MHIAEAESSIHEPFRVNFSYEDKTRFDYWQRMSLTESQWRGVKQHCEEAGVEFLVSPFSCAAVDLLERLGVMRYKIGSGEMTNFLMLEKIGQTGKPVILSSGMSSFSELDGAISFLTPFGNDLSILQCTTQYPTPPEALGLNVIAELRERYPNHRIGLSEHTGELYAGLAGVALGAEVLEFHAVFDHRMFGPDATSSLTIDEIKLLVEQVRLLERSLHHPVDKSSSESYADLKRIFEKSLAVNKDLREGHIIQLEDLESKKPADQGIAASAYQDVIGQRLAHDLAQWSFLQPSDIENA